MKSIFLTKYGNASSAFETKEMPMPEPNENEVRIKVEVFGLNFADVMARRGLYQDCPPLPCVLGYEVVGRIESVGKQVKTLSLGDRVAAFTHFGGYSEYVVIDERGAAKIPDEMPANFAAALVTQYCTAYFASMIATKVFEGEKVLIHAAAGGLGTAFVQLLKLRKAVIFGTCSSDEKVNYLRSIGVQYPINYKTSDYKSELKKILGKERIDVVFDSLGGKYIRDGVKLLGPCGRMVCLGGAELLSTRNLIVRIGKMLQFGFYHPGLLMMKSKAIIGVNMLKVAENKPEVLFSVLNELILLEKNGLIMPSEGKEYPITKLNEAHAALENRTTIGKIVVRW